MSGAVDQKAFENAIRDNLSPEGVAAIIALLQIAATIASGTPENERAINQVNWFRRHAASTMIGVEEFNRVDGRDWFVSRNAPPARRGGWFPPPDDGSHSIARKTEGEER